MSVINDKTTIRQSLLSRRRALNKNERSERSQKAIAHLHKLCHQQAFSFVAGYAAMEDELSLNGFLFSSPFKWSLPKVFGEALKFYQCFSEGDLMRGTYGIQEPTSTCKEVQIESLDCVVVPGVAFDRSGRRLGMGKGYYDRTLENYDGLKIGLSFQFQFLDDYLPYESHDLKMDIIVTENFIYSPYEEKRIS